MGKTINQLTKEAQKQVELMVLHTNELGTVLMKLGSVSQTETKKPVGRPKKTNAKQTVAKRGPGRPKKMDTPVAEVKRGPGRPKKTASPLNEVKRGPGRPKKVDVAVNKQKQTVDFSSKSELKRLKKAEGFNEWQNSSTSEREVWQIENGTYLGVIEGFYSSGNSGRYGITTRIFINPNSSLVPEGLKGHINTAAVNRIRYVNNKEEGLDYIEKQKGKVQSQFFEEILPNIISDHGKKGSVYAFHLDKDIRKKFKELKKIFKPTTAKQKELKMAK